MALVGLAILRFEWRLLVEAALLAGPVQTFLMYFGHIDPDYFRVLIDAWWNIPHLRSPE